MKKLASFVLLVALIAADIAAVQAAVIPAWCLLIAPVLGVFVVVMATLAVAREASLCQVCEKPLADRRAAGDYALKYGVRACGECGPKLDRRFGDEPPVGPTYPPYYH
ncbi:MAG TPA: hypothetical protein VL500_01645 [Candidatus Eisenbacteria bacterium]|jgi:hypothetical protein|nr:hypothetical protein [Candidatus Eisenbacteria bacterium]